MFLKLHIDCLAASYIWCHWKTKLDTRHSEVRARTAVPLVASVVILWIYGMGCYVDMLNFVEEQWHISTRLNGVTHISQLSSWSQWTPILAYRFQELSQNC